MVLLKLLKTKVLPAWQHSLLDWLVLAEAWWLLLHFYIALRWISFEHLMISTRSISEKVPNSSHTLTVAQQAQRLVGYAAQLHLIPMTCLVKSLTLQKILSRQNIPAQVKIGAQKIHDTICAYAWVEVDGKPIGEMDNVAQKFKVLESAVKFNTRQFV
jgi:hypothetical protein